MHASGAHVCKNERDVHAWNGLATSRAVLVRRPPCAQTARLPELLITTGRSALLLTLPAYLCSVLAALVQTWAVIVVQGMKRVRVFRGGVFVESCITRWVCHGTMFSSMPIAL